MRESEKGEMNMTDSKASKNYSFSPGVSACGSPKWLMFLDEAKLIVVLILPVCVLQLEWGNGNDF